MRKRFGLRACTAVNVGGGATPNWEENKLSRIPLRWMIRECFNCNTGILFDARMLQRIGLPVFKNALGEPELAPLYKFTPAPAPVKPYSRPVRKAWWKVLFAALWCPFALIGRLLFSWNKKPQKPEHWDGEEPPEFDLVDIPEDYELQNDLADSRTETHDQLEKKFLWVLLDWFPQRVKKQKAIINKLESGDSYKWLWNRGSGRKIPKTEIEEGLQVHRTVKMRLEQLGEAYAPQARPNIHIARVDEAGNKIKEPRRMTHYEWNNPNPEQWKWVGECELPKN
ncbi:hypothetical protein NM688_g8839 [Phlebia brevispora]|uniref:Uncharacterized protein n=1 Tax=Phlebia brevispora TaxID=194682 RepID=A0ACC1RME0_9APHY|nr:hypothetical protein NM688_g8839 [Phlebia brevispora]